MHPEACLPHDAGGRWQEAGEYGLLKAKRPNCFQFGRLA
jgi:hypothetical protein